MLPARGRNATVRTHPIECGAGVGLAPGRDIAMSYQPIGGQSRIGFTKRGDDRAQRVVLSCLVRHRIDAFEFYPDRKVIAGRPSAVIRLTGMPGSIIEADELSEYTVARDDQMRRHSQIADLGKIRVRVERQRVGEKPFYPGAAELSGRQTDAMYDDQFRVDPRGSRIAVRRSDLLGALNQSSLKFNVQANTLPARQGRVSSICDNR
jgi:hypothetical protein